MSSSQRRTRFLIPPHIIFKYTYIIKFRSNSNKSRKMRSNQRRTRFLISPHLNFKYTYIIKINYMQIKQSKDLMAFIQEMPKIKDGAYVINLE